MTSAYKNYLFSSLSIFAFSSSPIAAQESIGDGLQEEMVELVVTGSRIRKKDLTSNSPIQSVDGAKLRASASTNIVTELQSLPAFSPARSPVDGDTSGFTGSFLDLRGLGRGRTLTIVDGRRWLNTISDGGVDVSTIPPELVERVEVVTGGASATYGSDAVAGVVNIILRKDIEGTELNAQSGLTGKGEATGYRFSATGGSFFGDDRGHFTYHLSYDKSLNITADSRDFLNPARANTDGALIPHNTPLFGSALIPLNEDFTEAALFNNGSLFNSEGTLNLRRQADYPNFGRYARVQGPAQKYQIFANINYQLSDSLKVNLEGTFIREEIGIELRPTAFTIEDGIRYKTPFIDQPSQSLLAGFDENGTGIAAIPMTRLFSELGPRTENNDRNSYRVMAGFELALQNDWLWETSAVHSESNFTIDFSNYLHIGRLMAGLHVVESPNGTQCSQQAVGSIPCVPVNIYSQNGISHEAADFIRANGSLEGNNTDTTITSVVSGDLFELPAGAVGIALGVEYRRNSATEAPSRVLKRPDTSLPGLAFFNGILEQREVFGEAIVPLLSDHDFANYLGLEIGARYTNFKPGKDAVTYKLLAEWSPVENIRFRGGFQAATRAPNPYELGANDGDIVSVNGELSDGDPCFTGEPLTGSLRANCLASGVPEIIADTGAFTSEADFFTSSFLGNPDLSPEKAKTLTVGAVFRDLLVPGINLTVDYYDIDLKNTITDLDGTLFIENCFSEEVVSFDAKCDRIRRDPETGKLSEVQGGYLNAGASKLSGIDVSLNYIVDITSADIPSSISVNFAASHMLESKVTPFTEQSDFVLECIGYYGPTCGNPRPAWKTNFDVSWTLGPVSTTLNWSWIGATKDDAHLFAPDLLPTIQFPQLDAASYFDLSVDWQPFEGWEIRGGVDNMFNRKPAVVGTDRAGGVFAGLYDTIGRRFYLGLSVTL